MSDGVRALIVAHSGLGPGLIEAARTITGAPEEALASVSNAGRSPDDLAAAIDAYIRDGEWILFTDMHVGSCAFAARRLCNGRSNVVVVTGVNLPMLVDFAVHRDMPLTELADRLVQKGQQGICAAAATGGGDARRTVSSG